MAQFLVRNIEEEVKAEIQERARRHRRSMEAEVRQILRDATRKKTGEEALGLGSQIAARFRGIGTKLEKLPFEAPRPAKFGR